MSDKSQVRRIPTGVHGNALHADARENAVGVVNNTESISFENDGKRKPLDLQMVVRQVTPGWVVRKMAAP